MSRFRGFPTATAYQWREQVERLSSVEVILLCGWLLLIVVHRACDMIGEFYFFWLQTTHMKKVKSTMIMLKARLPGLYRDADLMRPESQLKSAGVDILPILKNGGTIA
ncbi:hypothetical protein M758_UG105600 [Ceratodon purpureus]|nr:hypothetical protein M758_UG105600 [Ceratodon purpureus]